MYTSSELRKILGERFGFDGFRPGQEEAIQTLFAEGRLVCIQPTGHGKSLLYQLPAVLLDGMTLVISPLLALMRDQIHQLQQRFDIPAGSINSDQTEDENAKAMEDARAGRLRILFVAPERLDNLESFAFVTTLPVDLVVVDEAHCISTWGHDFRPSYRQIVQATQELESLRPEIRLLGLTATADARTEADIVSQFQGRDGQLPAIQRSNMDRPNLHLSVMPLSGLDRKLAILSRWLKDQDGFGILYCATRQQTEIVAGFLGAAGIEIAAYHAGLDPDDKRDLQTGFLSGSPRIIAATNALGMGIDKSDIRFVVHVDVPGSITAYYQEVGRAGRDGEPASGLLLYDEKDREVQDYFINSAQPTRDEFDAVLQALGSCDAIRRDVAVRTGFHPTKVTVILAELQEQGFCEKRLLGRRQCFVPLARDGEPDLGRYERQLGVRTGELEAILGYGSGETGCLMQALRLALGDDAAEPCGRCCRCVPEAHPPVKVTDEEAAAARRWVVRRELAIPGSRQPLMATGYTLLDGEVRTPLFVDFMRQRENSRRELLDDALLELLEERVQTLHERHQVVTVTALPTQRWQQRDAVGQWVAELLGATWQPELMVWDQVPLSRQGELLNNDQRRQNVAGRMTLYGRPLRGGSVLLLDDYYGSSTTLKEAVRALRKIGGVKDDIVPLTIARVRWRLGSRGMI